VLGVGFWKNKGHPKEAEARQIARSLLAKKYSYIDPVRSFPDYSGEIFSPIYDNYSVKTLLQDDYLPVLVENVFAEDGELYGRFVALRKALAQLARSGIVDRPAFQDGEGVLKVIVSHILKSEHLHKLPINPTVADSMVAIQRRLRDLLEPALLGEAIDDPGQLENELVNSQATPNQIDAQQSSALKYYQWCRKGREAFENIAIGVQEINAALDRREPGPDKLGFTQTR
jgi:hypothetical protein